MLFFLHVSAQIHITPQKAFAEYLSFQSGTVAQSRYSTLTSIYFEEYVMSADMFQDICYGPPPSRGILRHVVTLDQESVPRTCVDTL